jgi:hypothetical protein
LQPHLGTGGQTESYQNGVSSLASSQRINRLEAQCRALIDPWLGQVIKLFFDQLPDRLFASARDAGNNAEQRDYLDAMMELKQRRNQLEPEIAAAVPQWTEGSASPTEWRLELAGVGAQLSLVKDNDLEHLLARAELVSQAESRHRAALYQLGQRFEALLGTRTGAGNLPVAPQVFSDAFSNALGGLGFTPTQLRATYKVLADALVPLLGDLYKALNELLAREGILPISDTDAVPPIPNPGHQLEASAGPARTVPSQPSDNWLVTPNVASLTAGLTSTRRLRRAIPISSSTACSHCNGNSKPRRPSRAMATEGPRRDPHFPRSKRERPRPSRVSMRVRSRSYFLSCAGASTFRKTSATGRSGNDCSPNCKGGLVGHSHDTWGNRRGTPSRP